MSTPQPTNYYELMLGLPAEARSPNHYELLGVELFEKSPETISHAAVDRISMLSDEWEIAGEELYRKASDISHQIADARDCLLDPALRNEYDTALRKSLGSASAKSPKKTAPKKQKIAATPAAVQPKPRVNNPYHQLLDLPATQTDPDHFELLGISAQESDVRRITVAAYEQALRILESVDSTDATTREQARVVDDRIRNAKETLTDDGKRRAYITTLGGAPAKSATKATPSPDTAKVRVDCPQCSRTIQVPEAYRGHTGSCQYCSAKITIPTLDAAPTASAPSTQHPVATRRPVPQPAPQPVAPQVPATPARVPSVDYVFAAQQLASDYGINLAEAEVTSVLSNLQMLNQLKGILKQRFPAVPSAYRPYGRAPELSIAWMAVTGILCAGLLTVAFWPVAGALAMSFDASYPDERDAQGVCVCCWSVIGFFVYSFAGGLVSGTIGLLVAFAGRLSANRNALVSAGIAWVVGAIGVTLANWTGFLFDGLSMSSTVGNTCAVLLGISVAGMSARVAFTQTASMYYCEKCEKFMTLHNVGSVGLGGLATLIKACEVGNSPALIGATTIGTGTSAKVSLRRCPSCETGIFEADFAFSRQFKAGEATQTKSETWKVLSHHVNNSEVQTILKIQQQPAAVPTVLPQPNPTHHGVNPFGNATNALDPLQVGIKGKSGNCPNCSRSAWWDGNNCDWCHHTQSPQAQQQSTAERLRDLGVKAKCPKCGRSAPWWTGDRCTGCGHVEKLRAQQPIPTPQPNTSTASGNQLNKLGQAGALAVIAFLKKDDVDSAAKVYQSLTGTSETDSRKLMQVLLPLVKQGLI